MDTTLIGDAAAHLNAYVIPEVWWTNSPKFPAYIRKIEYEFAHTHNFLGTQTSIFPEFKMHIGFFAVAIPREGITYDEAPAPGRTADKQLSLLQDTESLTIAQALNIVQQRLRFPPAQPSTRAQKRRWKWLALRTVDMPYVPKAIDNGRTDPVIRSRLSLRNLKLSPYTVCGLCLWLSQDENDIQYSHQTHIVRKAYARASTSAIRQRISGVSIDPFKIRGSGGAAATSVDARLDDQPAYCENYVAALGGKYTVPANNTSYQLG